MARAIAMPSKDQVPEGPHRDFLIIVFQMYRQAGRPSLKQIVNAAERMDLQGTASMETIRRTLRGKIIPERWETAYAVYAPLCQLAEINPEAEYYMAVGDDWDDRYEPPKSTHKEQFRRVWSAAFDTEELPPPLLDTPVTIVPPSNSSVRLGGFGGSDFSDEPPF
ncbi:hypothetical protein AB0K18_33695 [Nonomuraea sp. NPDC049421]|uniref:hypothetical protein n=1 Tax=Nonomuraea sp. NPDC049421 TaxID=3155275 RepID=UPI003448DAA2